MPQPILRVQRLTKIFGEYTAVDNLSFSVLPGEIFGLLGPNGAGKSTTIQMLLGLTEPDSGSIEYFGKDFMQEREYCLQRINHGSAFAQVQGKLTVWQNLYIYAQLYQVKRPAQRVAEVMALLEIEPQKDQLFWHLSSGQRTRVMLAKALINTPKLLLLDEPTASLDPDIVVKIIELIRDLQQKQGMSLVYTSHNMEEITRLCNRVLFLYKGKTVDIATPQEFTKRIDQVQLTIGFDGVQKPVVAYAKKEKLKYVVVSPQFVEFTTTESSLPSILFDLKKAGVWITDIDIRKPTMEDVFVRISQGAHELETN